jgi:hypothetical protein
MFAAEVRDDFAEVAESKNKPRVHDYDHEDEGGGRFKAARGVYML